MSKTTSKPAYYRHFQTHFFISEKAELNMKKIITLSLIIFGLLNLSFAVEKTEINLKVFVPKTGINVGTHYIPEPKEGETPMEVFALGSFPKTDKVTWTGAEEFFDVTVKDEKLQEGWSKVQIIPKKAGFGNLSLQVDQKNSDGKELPPLIFTEKIFVYKVEIKNGDGSALENQIFIGKDQERSFKAVVTPTEMETAANEKLAWEWKELPENLSSENKTLEIIGNTSLVQIKGMNGSSTVDGTELQCTLTVNDTLKSEYLSSKKMTVCNVKFEVDVDDNGVFEEEEDDSQKESPGMIIFENCDNDNNDNNFMPDNTKDSVDSENDLVQVRFKIEPKALNFGIIEVTNSGTDKLKFWKNSTKGEKIQNLIWNLETNYPTEFCYLEGNQKSNTNNDIQLNLNFTINGKKITDDKINITIIKLNLGIAIYRPLNSSPVAAYGHTGLITGYLGKRRRNDLHNNRMWETIESGPDVGVHQSNLQIFTNTLYPLIGYYSVKNLTDIQRNNILKKSKDCLTQGIGYPSISYNLNINAIECRGDIWNGLINSITALRCDGLVEVCYELAGMDVWGKKGQHYPIQNFAEEHNISGMDDPQTELSPVVQRGGVANSPTRFVQIYSNETHPHEPQKLE